MTSTTSGTASHLIVISISSQHCHLADFLLLRLREGHKLDRFLVIGEEFSDIDWAANSSEVYTSNGVARLIGPGCLQVDGCFSGFPRYQQSTDRGTCLVSFLYSTTCALIARHCSLAKLPTQYDCPPLAPTFSVHIVIFLTSSD